MFSIIKKYEICDFDKFNYSNIKYFSRINQHMDFARSVSFS